MRPVLTLCFLLAFSAIFAQPPTQAAKPLYMAMLRGEWCNATPAGNGPFSSYVSGYQDFLETALHASDTVFDAYFDRTEERIAKMEGENAFASYARAEFTLQRAFIEVKAGNELTAAWKLRQAYRLTEQALEDYPDYEPLYKTRGIMYCLIGSIPENLQWISGLFGLSGTISQGIADLSRACEGAPWLCEETNYLLALCYSYLLSENDKAIYHAEQAQAGSGHGSLPAYLLMNIYLRAHRAESALQAFASLEPPACMNIPQTLYLLGNAYLQKGEYRTAREAYAEFLKVRTSDDFVRDAWYKTGLAWWLEGDEENARLSFEKAQSEGSNDTEADRYAQRESGKALPDQKIMQLRLYTDGGYYERAHALARSLDPRQYTAPAVQTELVYRKARLAHLTGDTDDAISDYKNVVALQGDEPWYFAPNACLQIGYLMSARNPEEARLWFDKVDEYSGYEYRKGIERKARAALDQLD